MFLSYVNTRGKNGNNRFHQRPKCTGVGSEATIRLFSFCNGVLDKGVAVVRYNTICIFVNMLIIMDYPKLPHPLSMNTEISYM